MVGKGSLAGLETGSALLQCRRFAATFTDGLNGQRHHFGKARPSVLQRAKEF